MSNIKLDIRKRGTGKTHDLVVESARTGFPIVCNCSNEADRIKEYAIILKLEIPDPCSIGSIHCLRGRGVKGVLIDELISCLNQVIGIRIHHITASQEDFEYNE
jgi:hypothetical protein